MEIVKRVRPPRGLARLLFRLPVHVYRLGLGRIFGTRMMLLHHTGRVSGLPRRTVVEVVERDPGGYVAASGFGPRADWYRNVRANPDVTLQVGGRTVRATARPLPEAEGGEVMARYGRRHPRAARRLSGLMGFAVDGTEADYRELGRQIPFVRFEPGD
ncbi:deazaflavin-dependent oxidoreductase (nitroreductase family) [Prauserella shujinwangii]|uniref:Deazaflavin-dependent oxidoreductase (Nitroreductase family) n=1 Tax=Prauserella shujinwangii TaxID=1453103 RepID=A0A2T0LKV9_9PSEU|nr:nitroreductase family deazaflavin-dependent oxidoreductase [Prauserella shujinwangii]PRX43473.1 deazaflavin-dependent oxidoreductase (nitroreductase family) [Prauserella shujinwangii]